jgi:hypothetical protein
MKWDSWWTKWHWRFSPSFSVYLCYSVFEYNWWLKRAPIACTGGAGNHRTHRGPRCGVVKRWLPVNAMVTALREEQVRSCYNEVSQTHLSAFRSTKKQYRHNSTVAPHTSTAAPMRCVSSDQVAHDHDLDSQSSSQSLTRRLSGLGVRYLLLVCTLEWSCNRKDKMRP